jgi:hypothetical protein
MHDYRAPVTTGKTKTEIFAIAERYAETVGFLPGDRIEPLVGRLGGTIQYLAALDSVDGVDGSLFVEGPGRFRILVSAFTGPERDRFTIAHELGHYVLHSGLGKSRIRAARFGSERVEWEANWFAAAFLMPERDFRSACAKYGNKSALVAARYLVSEKAAEVRMTALGI